MASGRESEMHGSRLCVLALSLLVGLVFGFVVLLSRLPVGMPAADMAAAEMQSEAGVTGYQFYSLLPESTIEQQQAAVREVVPPPSRTVPPATRVVPGSVQSLSARALVSENYAEVPANSVGHESYFLQAGNYRQKADAEKTRASLLLLGLESTIVPRQDNNGVIGHRVRIGPFFDQERISIAKERLKRNGISYKLIRVTG
ncbi:SPOR domain-containing protein [Granulosicoccus sp. 3-233]|uniref:SPOR domain-containing protein n=1 Tax=Granulosicoccus sp. 3-233 TaxID=3417969 RepID=UPI003D33F752